MFRNIALIAASALTLTAGGVIAAGEGGHIEDVAFAHEGPFGKFDQFQLQRGLQVYTEVCSGCHGLKYVPLRTLSDEGGPGIPEDQVRAYAKQFTVTDKETGEDREGLPTDTFPANTGAGAPDLSLMAKAREGGPEYIASLLQGYGPPEHGVTLAAGQHYNKYFPGHGVPYAVVLPYPDPVAGWPEDQRAWFDRACGAAAHLVTLERARPADLAGRRAAMQRRDGWLRSVSAGAVVVTDGRDVEAELLLRRFTESLGDDVWTIEVDPT